MCQPVMMNVAYKELSHQVRVNNSLWDFSAVELTGTIKVVGVLTKFLNEREETIRSCKYIMNKMKSFILSTEVVH